MEESTDITNKAQFLTFVRYLDKNSVKVDFLFCETLSGRTTAQNIFQKIRFMKTRVIDWIKCISVCLDNAREMMGERGDVFAKGKEVASESKFVHCSFYREALASKKKMKVSLKTVLNESLKVVIISSNQEQ